MAAGVIAPPEIDPELLRELEAALARGWAEVVGAFETVGPGAPVYATALSVFPELVVGLVAAGALIGVVSGNPKLAALAGPIGVALAELVGPQPSVGRVLASKLEAARQAVAYARQVVTIVAGLGAEVMPSPAAVNAASGPTLANAVARIALWQRAHHAAVHGGLVDAQGRVDAATVAAAAATATSTVEVVRAIRGIVTVILPEAVLELTTTIQRLRVAQQAANAELTHELERTAADLARRIGDLVRWLKTEALPDLEEEVKAERLARKKEAAGLRVGIATEVDDRTSADASLLTQVAPLVAWAAAFGVHTTEKVKRNEDVIDQLRNLDLGAFLALTSMPALSALTMRLITDAVPHVPALVGGLEDAASKALGAF